jgi:4-diphosphocytidyl-2-C-methyl-D-erythritol kinase
MAAEALGGLAPPKVNLYLHVTGRRADGYHLLDSLVVVPELGDRLSLRPAAALTLSLHGPFAGAIEAGEENLVLRAARALAAAHALRPAAALTLEKRLPPAAGIGGGSADAAAALRLLARLWDVPVPDALPLSLGADVPVCLAAPEPRFMAGIGERLAPPPPLPGFWMVLANPRVEVPTPAVFAALARRDNPPAPPPPPLADFRALTGWLAGQRNDLEPAACALCPAIREVLAALADAPLARMSGSGATCFALHASGAEAHRQAGRLARARPGWWVAAAPVAAWPGAEAHHARAAADGTAAQAGGAR